MADNAPSSDPGLQGLTQKQRLFVEAYVATGNGTEAARRAGYSAKSTNSLAQQAQANLKIPQIKAAIEARQSNLMNEIGLTKQRVLKMMEDVALKATNSANPGSATKAVELLGREHGMFTERVEQTSALTVYTLDMGKALEEGDE